jgi:hypothetical protein
MTATSSSGKRSDKERTVLWAARDGRLVYTDGGVTWYRPRSSSFERTDVSELASALAALDPPLLKLSGRGGPGWCGWELTEAGAAVLDARAWDGDFPLVLETKDQRDKTVRFGGAALTPPIDEDYWLFRVKVSDNQAIVGFPKFSTIGVGFAVEEDWNTNLPYVCGAAMIWEHIRDNKGDPAIPDSRCLQAVTVVVEAARNMMAVSG